MWNSPAFQKLCGCTFGGRAPPGAATPRYRCLIPRGCTRRVDLLNVCYFCFQRLVLVRKIGSWSCGLPLQRRAGRSWRFWLPIVAHSTVERLKTSDPRDLSQQQQTTTRPASAACVQATVRVELPSRATVRGRLRIMASLRTAMRRFVCTVQRTAISIFLTVKTFFCLQGPGDRRPGDQDPRSLPRRWSVEA